MSSFSPPRPYVHAGKAARWSRCGLLTNTGDNNNDWRFFFVSGSLFSPPAHFFLYFRYFPYLFFLRSKTHYSSFFPFRLAAAAAAAAVQRRNNILKNANSPPFFKRWRSFFSFSWSQGKASSLLLFSSSARSPENSGRKKRRRRRKRKDTMAINIPKKPFPGGGFTPFSNLSKKSTKFRTIFGELSFFRLDVGQISYLPLLLFSGPGFFPSSSPAIHTFHPPH